MKISEIRYKIKINWIGITKAKFDSMTDGYDATYIDANVLIANKGYDNYRPIFQKFIELAIDDNCLVGFLKEMYDLLAWDKLIILPYRTLIDDLKSTKKNRYDVLYSMFSYYLEDTPIGIAKQTDEELFKKLMAEKFDDFLLGQPIELIRMHTRYNITVINGRKSKINF
ncbi:hypothetical protein [Serratia ureilytica]|uniref:hypothetical protein n=1 Tax=Serratia ureilytica TaxID=300181 RepID=UPI0019D0C63F|nr:hypothetical protein [Serratia ureilytica]MBN5214264.1 hypothetical protein [Serratia ureilytica]